MMVQEMKLQEVFFFTMIYANVHVIKLTVVDLDLTVALATRRKNLSTINDAYV